MLVEQEEGPFQTVYDTFWKWLKSKLKEMLYR